MREGARTENLLGACAVAITDRMRGAAERAADYTGSAPAALTTLLTYSDRTVSIEWLRWVLGLSHPATVRLVDRLSERGLVRRQSTADGRERALALTARGRAAAKRVLVERQRAVAEAVAPLDGAERAQLEELLERVLTAVTGGRLEARHICRLCDHGVCEQTGGCPVDEAATRLGQ